MFKTGDDGKADKGQEGIYPQSLGLLGSWNMRKLYLCDRSCDRSSKEHWSWEGFSWGKNGIARGGQGAEFGREPHHSASMFASVALKRRSEEEGPSKT